MNEILLAKAIRERLEYVCRNMQLSAEGRTFPVRPMVHNGYLPPKTTASQTDMFPYIIVKPMSGETPSQDDSTCAVDLLIGAYEETSDGYEQCLLIMAEVRKSLLKNPFIGGGFVHLLPFEWKMLDESPWPFWGVLITTRWQVPTPQVEDENL